MNGAAGRRVYGLDSRDATERLVDSSRSAAASDAAAFSSSAVAADFSFPVSSKSRPVAIRVPSIRTSFASKVSAESFGKQLRNQVPIVGAYKRKTLALALDNKPGCRGLYPACRKPWTDFAPQDGRHFESVQSVENSAGFLRVDEIDVNVSCVVASVLDGVLGDLVKHHALDREL